MAVGKGSMARASKAATKTTVAKETKATVKNTTAPKKTANKAAVKASTKANSGVASSAVISGTSEEVLKTIVYQQSAQVLDREPEMNEIFGVGEAMPIYFF